MLPKENVLIGYSGHAYVVADAALNAGIRVTHYADKKEAASNPYKLEYLGYEQDEQFNGWGNRYGFILGVGDNLKRKSIAHFIEAKQEILVTIEHPASFVSKNAKIGIGSFISSQVSVNAFATIGKYVILNTNSVVEHECQIGDAAHIAPGAVLAGNVEVGERSLIGANSVVKEGVKIGSDVVVGAGSTIIKDVPDGKKVAGNPGGEI